MHRTEAVRGWSDYSKSAIESYPNVFVISSNIHQGASNQHRLYLSFVLVSSLLHISIWGKTGSTVRPFWCVPHSFRHGRWAVCEGISSFTYSQALLCEGYIRGFHSELGSYKARPPRMQLLRQSLLRVLILSFFILDTLGQNSVQTFGWKFRTDVNKPLPWTLRYINA